MQVVLIKFVGAISCSNYILGTTTLKEFCSQRNAQFHDSLCGQRCRQNPMVNEIRNESLDNISPQTLFYVELVEIAIKSIGRGEFKKCLNALILKKDIDK